MTNDTPEYPSQAPTGTAPARPPGSDDLEHLRLLSIFHYILGGLTGLMSLFPVLHLVLFSVILSDPEVQSEPAAEVALTFMLVMTGAMILAGLTFAVCLVLAGRYLAARTHYSYCLVMAGISCLLVPLGTVLGIFTILVLLRPTVKERFKPVPAA